MESPNKMLEIPEIEYMGMRVTRKTIWNHSSGKENSFMSPFQSCFRLLSSKEPDHP